MGDYVFLLFLILLMFVAIFGIYALSTWAVNIPKRFVFFRVLLSLQRFRIKKKFPNSSVNATFPKKLSDGMASV